MRAVEKEAHGPKLHVAGGSWATSLISEWQEKLVVKGLELKNNTRILVPILLLTSVCDLGEVT